MKKTILITGINGFLGSNLAKIFKADYNIVGLEISTKNLHRLQDEKFPVYESSKVGLLINFRTLSHQYKRLVY